MKWICVLFCTFEKLRGGGYQPIYLGCFEFVLAVVVASSVVVAVLTYSCVKCCSRASCCLVCMWGGGGGVSISVDVYSP